MEKPIATHRLALGNLNMHPVGCRPRECDGTQTVRKIGTEQLLISLITGTRLLDYAYG